MAQVTEEQVVQEEATSENVGPGAGAYLMYFDDKGNKKLETRIRAGAALFEQRYGGKPNVVKLNPDELQEFVAASGKAEEGLKLVGMQVVNDREGVVRRNYYWFGREGEGEAANWDLEQTVTEPEPQFRLEIVGDGEPQVIERFRGTTEAREYAEGFVAALNETGTLPEDLGGVIIKNVRQHGKQAWQLQMESGRPRYLRISSN